MQSCPTHQNTLFAILFQINPRWLNVAPDRSHHYQHVLHDCRCCRFSVHFCHCLHLLHIKVLNIMCEKGYHKVYNAITNSTFHLMSLLFKLILACYFYQVWSMCMQSILMTEQLILTHIKWHSSFSFGQWSVLGTHNLLVSRNSEKINITHYISKNLERHTSRTLYSKIFS